MSIINETAEDNTRLINDINNHHCRDTALVYEHSEDGFSRRYLASNKDGTPADLVSLIDELTSRLNRTLITAQGQNSEEYYLLSNQPGIRIGALEVDSFGPLTMGVKHVSGNWWVTYG